MKGKKRGASYFYRTATTSDPSWRIKRELVVKDLPQRKISYLFDICCSLSQILIEKS
jgi:hypothetical protein